MIGRDRVVAELTPSQMCSARWETLYIAPRGVAFADVRRVHSHPVALAQCEKFLRANRQIEVAPAYDTAGSVKMVVENNSGVDAAIAGGVTSLLCPPDTVHEPAALPAMRAWTAATPETVPAPAAQAAGEEPELVSLYVAHKKIYPRSVQGIFAYWRWMVVFLTQLVFYGLPWLEWGQRQAVLFDLGARNIVLLSNTKRTVVGLDGYGITLVGQQPIPNI